MAAHLRARPPGQAGRLLTCCCKVIASCIQACTILTRGVERSRCAGRAWGRCRCGRRGGARSAGSLRRAACPGGPRRRRACAQPAPAAAPPRPPRRARRARVRTCSAQAHRRSLSAILPSAEIFCSCRGAWWRCVPPFVHERCLFELCALVSGISSQASRARSTDRTHYDIIRVTGPRSGPACLVETRHQYSTRALVDWDRSTHKFDTSFILARAVHIVRA